ncbi:MAG: hypothetical protein ABR556_13835, partial [Pyrinomonadaceae bacterium]
MYQPQFEEAVKTTRTGKGYGVRVSCAAAFVLVLSLVGTALSQAGRRTTSTNEGGVLVSVVAKRTDNSPTPISSKQLAVYDNGVEQTIRNFTPDPSP